jgi:UDP-2,3-diacylglucosamine pyrophosphatase LpxH
VKCALIIPDSHIPFHNRKAVSLMLEAAKNINVSEIVILGDLADFYCVSSHPKDPRVPSLLTEEIKEVNLFLDLLDKEFPGSQKIYLSGNHEFRLERYLIDKAPALFGTTSTEYLLNLNKRIRWKFITYGPNQIHYVLGSYLGARHEPIGTSAKLTASKALCNLVFGHTHRIEESHIVALDGTNHVCFSVGWLGDKRFDQVFNYVKGHHQWQLGFGIVYVDDKSRLFYHKKIHILENSGKLSCVVNGKVFKS